MPVTTKSGTSQSILEILNTGPHTAQAIQQILQRVYDDTKSQRRVLDHLSALIDEGLVERDNGVYRRAE